MPRDPKFTLTKEQIAALYGDAAVPDEPTPAPIPDVIDPLADLTMEETFAQMTDEEVEALGPVSEPVSGRDPSVKLPLHELNAIQRRIRL